MSTVAITGADGFLGWHTRVSAHALDGIDQRPIGRVAFNDPIALLHGIDGADHVVHCAGVNRGENSVVYGTNVDLAERLAAALMTATHRPRSLTFANSTQCRTPGAYGEGKARAAEVLAAACAASGVHFNNVQLPNLFGEHGRPGYNSVVATFCDALAHGQQPEVHDDKVLSLLGVRDATALLLAAAGPTGPTSVATTIEVSALLELLAEFDACYRDGDIPRIDTRFRTQLFNTYRSFTFPLAIPHAVEATYRSSRIAGRNRAHARRHGAGIRVDQPSRCRARPTLSPGQSGTVCCGRRRCDDLVAPGAVRCVITFEVHGDEPAIVDMPTLWTHNITNVGPTTLVTQFWTDQIFDAAAPDTYYEAV